MSSVIELLEKLGSDASWHNASNEAIKRELDQSNIEEPIRSAILDKDADRLQALLRLSPLFGIMIPAVPDEEQEDEEEEGDGKPGQKPKVCDSLSASLPG